MMGENTLVGMIGRMRPKSQKKISVSGTERSYATLYSVDVEYMLSV